MHATAKEEWDRVWDYVEWECNWWDDVDRFDDEFADAEDDVINDFGEYEPSNFVD